MIDPYQPMHDLNDRLEAEKQKLITMVIYLTGVLKFHGVSQGIEQAHELLNEVDETLKPKESPL